MQACAHMHVHDTLMNYLIDHERYVSHIYLISIDAN